MSKLTAAIVKEQGNVFTVIMVKQGYANQQTLNSYTQSMPHNLPRPIVLAEQSASGTRYFGHPNIVNFLSSIYAEQLPWKEYSLQ